MNFNPNQLNEMQTRFWKICHEKLSNRLPDEFVGWLQETDFFTAPASSKFHMNCEGGLLAHSLNVYNRLCAIVQTRQYMHYCDGELAVVALFHDLCKIGTYQLTFRHQKQPNGNWTQVPSYAIKNSLPMGHGEKSVYLLMKHGVKLTDEEALAIRWHMGAYDNAVKGGCRDMNEAIVRWPTLVLALQQADMEATYWDEN
jgi:hypothetical protein